MSVEDRGQHTARRLRGGEDERHQFVAYLLVGHVLAGLVADGEQFGQQVSAVGAVGPVSLDDALDGGANPLSRDGDPAQGRYWQPAHEVGQHRANDHATQHDRQALLHRLTASEQRSALKRVSTPIPSARTSAARWMSTTSPVRRRLLGPAAHDLDVACDPLAAEGRLHHASLAPVERAFRGQQAVTDDPAHLVEEPALVEARRIRHEHLVHKPGTGNRVGLHRSQVDLHRFADLGQRGQKTCGVFAEHHRVPERR
jgi:hypothetical protein